MYSVDTDLFKDEEPDDEHDEKDDKNIGPDRKRIASCSFPHGDDLDVLPSQGFA